MIKDTVQTAYRAGECTMYTAQSVKIEYIKCMLLWSSYVGYRSNAPQYRNEVLIIDTCTIITCIIYMYLDWCMLLQAHEINVT